MKSDVTKALAPPCVSSVCLYWMRIVKMSEAARDIVAAILSNEEIISTLANARVNNTQYRSTEEEVAAIFHRGRPRAAAGQAVPAYQAMASVNAQEAPTTAPIYNLRPFTRRGPRHRR